MDLATNYWKQVVEDYFDLYGFEAKKLTEEQIMNIVNKLLSDDFMWENIDNAVFTYINEEVGN